MSLTFFNLRKVLLEHTPAREPPPTKVINHAVGISGYAQKALSRGPHTCDLVIGTPPDRISQVPEDRPLAFGVEFNSGLLTADYDVPDSLVEIGDVVARVLRVLKSIEDGCGLGPPGCEASDVTLECQQIGW